MWSKGAHENCSKLKYGMTDYWRLSILQIMESGVDWDLQIEVKLSYLQIMESLTLDTSLAIRNYRMWLMEGDEIGGEYEWRIISEVWSERSREKNIQFSESFLLHLFSYFSLYTQFMKVWTEHLSFVLLYWNREKSS